MRERKSSKESEKEKKRQFLVKDVYVSNKNVCVNLHKNKHIIYNKYHHMSPITILIHDGIFGIFNGKIIFEYFYFFGLFLTNFSSIEFEFLKIVDNLNF